MKLWYTVFLLPVIVFAVAYLLYPWPTCGNAVVEGTNPAYAYEECDDGNLLDGDGCSALCLIEFPEKIYIAPYMGNVEGGFAEEWFYFYGQLIDFFNSEQIPVGVTIYPASINEKPEFAPYVKSLYESEYIEIVQKANTGLGEEQRMDKLSLERQKEIIREGRDVYRKSMSEILGIHEDEILLPFAYNQPQGRFTNETREAIEDLGFKIFFEMYLNEDIGPVESSATVDVLQYGVGFTVEGAPGRKTEFYEPREVLAMLKDFDRVDLHMLHIGENRIVPVWVHHMDFEHKNQHNTVDMKKWEIYTYVMERIRDEPNLIYVSPTEIWYLRH